jgi:hypothetical protein
VIVAQETERLVDVVKRGGMVPPDGMDQPQVVQGLRGCERVAGLFGGGQRPAGDRVGGVEAGGLPFDLPEQGQQPGLPDARQVDRCEGLP